MPQLPVSTKTWETEYASGRWDYLDTTPAERERSALIGMYCNQYRPTGRILDVGAGLGTTADFLKAPQRKKYLGIDISEHAVQRATKKGLALQQSDFATFNSTTKFDVIIFNEVLYYLDEVAALKKARTLLKKNGILVVSLYRMKHKHYDMPL